MRDCLFGMDLSGEITPIMVRDAIIECFYQAHRELLVDKIQVSDESKETFTKAATASIVKKMFNKNGLDFDNPTKEGLIKVCDSLAEFAKNFRDCETIKCNYQKIMSLIQRIKS